MTVDSTGRVTGASEGKAIVTATSVNGISASCNVTVKLPPPPSAGVGGSTHEAKEIPYTWEQLNDIAKVISDKYGTEEGKINNDTAEVEVVVEGEKGTLGIGDWTTVKYNNAAKKVRILGFNHDELVNTNAYGGTNTYAGISFEFLEFLTTGKMNSSNTNLGGWGVCNLREALNSTTLEDLENRVQIKEVSKQYISVYNKANSLTVSDDKLWLLSTCEIWGTTAQKSITTEGKHYKFYAMGGSAVKKSIWWLRSPMSSYNYMFCYVGPDGKASQTNANGSLGVAPGFCI